MSGTSSDKLHKGKPAPPAMPGDKTAPTETPATPSGEIDPQRLFREYSVVSHCLQDLLSRHDGWLRAIPANDGKVVYLKWKFNSGPWSGFYAFTQGSVYDLPLLFGNLCTQLTGIDEGWRKPTIDKFYEN